MEGDPTAISGTWSDVERTARWNYAEADEGSTVYELSEAVLVLLAETERLRRTIGSLGNNVRASGTYARQR